MIFALEVLTSSSRTNRTFGAYEEAVESLGTGGVNSGALQNLLAGNLATFTVAIDPQGKFPCGAQRFLETLQLR